MTHRGKDKCQQQLTQRPYSHGEPMEWESSTYRGGEPDGPEPQIMEGYYVRSFQESAPDMHCEPTSGKHSSGTPVPQVSIPLWRVWPDVHSQFFTTCIRTNFPTEYVPGMI